MNWALISTIVAAIMATTMIFVRAKVAKKPTTAKKIILPPLFMSTGALMFLFPTFHLSIYQVFEAIGVGMVCSIFLIKTSNFQIQNNEIYLIPSKAFIIIISLLLIIRIGVKLIIGQVIALGELSGMFYLLALGMIVTWRIAMLVKFISLKKSLH